MAKEMLDIYNEKQEFIGTKSYDDVHKDGDWHKVVGLFIINKNNEILMQRRSLQKATSPGLLTVSAGGHLNAGEDVFACMKRETKEEMGVEIDVSEAEFLYYCQDSKISNDKVFLAGYILHTEIDITTVRYDKNEIAEFVYIHYLDLKGMYKSGVKFGINNNVLIELFDYMDKHTTTKKLVARARTMRKHSQKINTVDCIIFTILEEEKNLFLNFKTNKYFGENNCFIIGKEEYIDNVSITPITFFDKDNYKRRCLVCCFREESNKKEMGSTATGKLFYIISRKYKSNLYINIGVAGAIKSYLGEVVLIKENTQVFYKNSDLETTQTNSNIDVETTENFYHNFPDDEITNLKNRAKDNIKKFYTEFSNYIEETCNATDKAKILKSIKKDEFERKANSDNLLSIHLGDCITSSIVEKNIQFLIDKQDNIKNFDVLEMEAGFFSDWHKLLKRKKDCPRDSKLLIIKSPSDTCTNEMKLKEILEDAGARGLAMANIFDFSSSYLTKVHNFKDNRETLEQYLIETISKKHLRKLNENIDDNAICNLFKPPIIEIENKDTKDNTLRFLIDCVNNNENILIQGSTGKGKNKLLAYLYEKCTKDKIYIRVHDIIDGEYGLNFNIFIELLKKLFANPTKKYVCFFEKYNLIADTDRKKIEKNLLNIFRDKFSICMTFGTGDANVINATLDEVRESLKKNEFKEVFIDNLNTINETDVTEFIKDYTNLYNKDKTDYEKNNFIVNCRKIVKDELKEIKHIDISLLELIASHNAIFRNNCGMSLCNIIETYCNDNGFDKLKKEVLNSKKIDKNNFGILQRNVLCRCFTYSKLFYDFTNDINKHIEIFNNNDFVFSDYIDYFLSFLQQKKIDQSEDYIENVILNINNISKGTTKCELLYLIARAGYYENIKDITNETIEFLKTSLKKESGKNISHCKKTLKYRKLALLTYKYGNNEEFLANYLKLLEDDIRKKYNLSFYLRYYSQNEFSYRNVYTMCTVDDITKKADPTMVRNTFNRLKKSLKDISSNPSIKDKMDFQTFKYLCEAFGNDTNFKKLLDEQKKELSEIDKKFE